MSATTPGLVCAHHHLYSALARGMPPPPKTPTNFQEVLEQIWWRLDTALDLEMIRWSAMLGALEALESGTTAIVDHHESPNAIEGSLSVIADACAEVGVRVLARLRDHRSARRRRRPPGPGGEPAVRRTKATKLWSASTRLSPAPTSRWKPRPASPRNSGWACTSTLRKGSAISTPRNGSKD